MLVKANAAHTQPGSHSYREEGEEFEHDGKLYEHVEAVKSPAKGKPDPKEE